MGVCGCVGVCVKARMSLETMSKQELVMKPREAPKHLYVDFKLMLRSWTNRAERKNTQTEKLTKTKANRKNTLAVKT